MATWGLNVKDMRGTVEARMPPGVAEKIPVNCCLLCTGSPPWPSAGYLAPIRAPWIRLICQVTSTSSCSGSTAGAPAVEACCSTASWNLRSPMHLFGTRISSPPNALGRCRQSRQRDEGILPAWRCLPRTGHGGEEPTQIKRTWFRGATLGLGKASSAWAKKIFLHLGYIGLYFEYGQGHPHH